MTATVALALLAAACGDDEGGDETSGTTTTTPPDETTTTPPPTTALTPEEEVEAVYLEFVDVVERLLTTGPDPDDPDLERLATEPILGTLRDNLTTMQAEHHIVQRGERTSQRVMSVTLQRADQASVRVCSVGNDTTIDQDDGSIIDQGLTTRVLDATVVLVDGRWAVSDVGTRVRLDGEMPCPE